MALTAGLVGCGSSSKPAETTAAPAATEAPATEAAAPADKPASRKTGKDRPEFRPTPPAALQ